MTTPMMGERTMAGALPSTALLWCTLGKHHAAADAFARCTRNKSGRQSSCRSCKSEYMADYFATPEGRAKRQEATRRWEERNPERAAAHKELAKALRKGTVRPSPCVMQGEAGHVCHPRLEAHHPDYRFPLAVLWVCRNLHDVIHHTPETLPEWLAAMLGRFRPSTAAA